MSYNFFAYISRMRYIARWGLMRNSSPENVQEHSLMVAAVAHALAEIGLRIYSRNIDPGEVAAAAMLHDAPEIFTGDMPTPIKYFNPEISSAYKAVERHSEDRLISMLPEELREDYTRLLRPEGEIKAIVKAADKLCAYIKCLEELRSGNGEFTLAAEQTRQKIMENPLPEVTYFMENFIPAFEKTLDELE